MLKNISNLKGAKTLNREEQKEINGGRMLCLGEGGCTSYGRHCAEPDCIIAPWG